MGRRGENIRYRKWDRRWESRVVCGPPENGRTSYHYIYGNSYKEVSMKKKAYEELLSAKSGSISETGSVQFGDGRFADAAERWLESKKTVLKESSYATYSYLVSHYLVPRLGDTRLDFITGEMLEDLFRWLREHGRNCRGSSLSDKTLSDVKAVLVQVLSYASSHGMMTSAPDCPSIPTKKPTAKALDAREQEEMENAAMMEDTCFAAAVILLLYSGLRVGEICGLMWGDIDLEAGTLRVERTVSRIRDMESGGTKTKVVIGSPKTDCSRRTVPLPDDIVVYLKQHRLNDDIYLASGTGKYMEPRAFLSKFKRFQKRNGLNPCTVHTLRHTFATRCIEYGVDVKSLSEIMGHANVRITMQLYVHPSMETKKAEVNKLPCKFLSGQESGRDIWETFDLYELKQSFSYSG